MFDVSDANRVTTAYGSVAINCESITMNGAHITDLGWNAQSFDVSAHAGSTVRVHFREFIPENFTGPANIELDDISLVAVLVPEPASIVALFGGILVLSAIRRNR